MTDLTVTFNTVSLPANTSGTVTVYEDQTGDGTSDFSDSAALSNGVTSYTLTGYQGGNDVWPEVDLDNTDVTATGSTVELLSVTTAGQTVNAPVTTLTSTTPAPGVSGSGTATIQGQETTLTSSTPAPQVTAAGVATIAAPETTLTLTTPPPDVGGPWTIHTKNNGSFPVDFVVGGPHSFERGATTSITLDSGSFGLLQDLMEYAGEYATIEGLNGTVRYREQIPSSADVGSIVVGIEPRPELKRKNIVGIWGIIDDASNERGKPLTTDRVELTMTVVARYDDHADHAELESALQI